MKMSKNKKKYNCKDIENKIQEFLDDQLSEQQLNLYIEHLDYCLPCDKKVEFEKKLKEIIKCKAAEKSYPAELEKELKNIISKL